MIYILKLQRLKFFKFLFSIEITSTVFAQIEGHSWLERHEAQNGHFWPKMVIVSSLKLIEFNKTPAFYLRRYSMLTENIICYSPVYRVIKIHLKKVYFQISSMNTNQFLLWKWILTKDKIFLKGRVNGRLKIVFIIWITFMCSMSWRG